MPEILVLIAMLTCVVAIVFRRQSRRRAAELRDAIAVRPIRGDYVIHVGNQSTGPIPYNASAEQVSAALSKLDNVVPLRKAAPPCRCEGSDALDCLCVIADVECTCCDPEETESQRVARNARGRFEPRRRYAQGGEVYATEHDVDAVPAVLSAAAWLTLNGDPEPAGLHVDVATPDGGSCAVAITDEALRTWDNDPAAVAAAFAAADAAAAMCAPSTPVEPPAYDPPAATSQHTTSYEPPAAPSYSPPEPSSYSPPSESTGGGWSSSGDSGGSFSSGDSGGGGSW